MHNVLLERNAEKDLDRLPPNIRSRVVSALRSLAENPRPRGCRKLIGGINDWRIRVGEHRVLYEIDDRNKLVLGIASDTAETLIADRMTFNPIEIEGIAST